MFKGIPKQAFIITIVLVTLIYMGTYMFITYNQEVDLLGNATEFLNSLKHTFLAACAITSITAIILVFNSNVQSRQEKKKAVFDKKIKLYLDIIDSLDQYFKPKDDEKDTPKIDENEKRELFFLQLKVLLLSNPATSSLYADMVKDLTAENNEIKGSSYINLMNFIFGAREDLEVQEKMSEEQREKFEDMKQSIKEEAENVAQIGRRTYFTGGEPIEQYINQDNFKKISSGLINKLKDIDIYIRSQFEKNSDVQFDYSKTGGLACFGLGKKHASKFGYLRFEDERKNGFVALYLLKSPPDYAVPKIDGLTIHQSYHGNEFYTIRFFEKNSFTDKVKELIKISYETRNNNQVLKDDKTKPELRELAEMDLSNY